MDRSTKFNIVIFCLGTFLIIKGLLTLVPAQKLELKKRIHFISLITFIAIGITYIFQSVSAAITYINGFKGDRKLITVVLISGSISTVIGLIYITIGSFKKGIIKSKQDELNDKLNDLSLDFHNVVQEIRDIEIISNSIEPEDNAWKIVTAKKARELYNQIDKHLRTIESIQN